MSTTVARVGTSAGSASSAARELALALPMILITVGSVTSSVRLGRSVSMALVAMLEFCFFLPFCGSWMKSAVIYQ
ncbi:hypothetical protein LINPERPRIM_LOCUS36700 [Linum perenne]